MSAKRKKLRPGVIAEVVVALLLPICAVGILLHRYPDSNSSMYLGDGIEDSIHSMQPDSICPDPPRRERKKKDSPQRPPKPTRNPLDEHVPSTEDEL